MIRAFRSALTISFMLTGWASMSLLGACHSSASPEADKATAKPPGKEEAQDGVHLNPDEIAALGAVTQALAPTSRAPEVSGFGVVVSHESLAQGLADLRTAAAVARQSRAALERARRLASTPGAMPLDAMEAAQRQSTVDDAALDLARQRLSSTFGQQAPWNGRDDSLILQRLARGDDKLIRVTFPMSAMTDGHPVSVRLGRIGVAPTARTWDAKSTWPAPADTTVPGRSFFAIVNGDGFGEGERLLAWTPVGERREGVLVPESAAVILNGSYWCYVQAAAGTFKRTAFDATIPTNGGYFVTGALAAGDQVVIKAAGQLLAKEVGGGTESE